jgi:DNA-binding ferritin-like protein
MGGHAGPPQPKRGAGRRDCFAALAMTGKMGSKFDVMKITVEQLREMATTMDCKSLPPELVEYMGYMEKARDWHYQMKSRLFVTKHLKLEYLAKNNETLSDYLARQIYDNAMNYYYADRTIRKESWRNMLAEKYQIAAQLCFDKNDLEGHRKFLEAVERVMRLNEADEDNIDPKLLDRRPFVYVVSGKDLGIPEVDRWELARQIDTYDIKESMKVRLKREAGSLPRKLFDQMEVEDVDTINDGQ